MVYVNGLTMQHYLTQEILKSEISAHDKVNLLNSLWNEALLLRDVGFTIKTQAIAIKFKNLIRECLEKIEKETIR